MGFLQLLEKVAHNGLESRCPPIRLGATIRVGVVIREGDKSRVQVYQGILIAQRSSGATRTITIRRVFQGIGVERVFFIFSCTIQYVNILRHATVRRAKLYYLRNVKGKAKRLRTRLVPNRKT